jgi:hypothetical protein
MDSWEWENRSHEHESYLEHRGRHHGALRGDLVSARHQRLTGQLHDGPDSMGGVRWDRGRSGALRVAGCQPTAEKQTLRSRFPNQLNAILRG